MKRRRFDMEVVDLTKAGACSCVSCHESITLESPGIVIGRPSFHAPAVIACRGCIAQAGLMIDMAQQLKRASKQPPARHTLKRPRERRRGPNVNHDP